LTPLPESSFKPCRFLYATSTRSPAAGGFVAARVWVLTRVVVWPSCVPSPQCESGSWLACSSFIPWCHCAVTRECEAVLASPHCKSIQKATAQAPAPAHMHRPDTGENRAKWCGRVGQTRQTRWSANALRSPPSAVAAQTTFEVQIARMPVRTACCSQRPHCTKERQSFQNHTGKNAKKKTFPTLTFLRMNVVKTHFPDYLGTVFDRELTPGHFRSLEPDGH
jgi:hypothetical protein